MRAETAEFRGNSIKGKILGGVRNLLDKVSRHPAQTIIPNASSPGNPYNVELPSELELIRVSYGACNTAQRRMMVEVNDVINMRRDFVQESKSVSFSENLKKRLNNPVPMFDTSDKPEVRKYYLAEDDAIYIMPSGLIPDFDPNDDAFVGTEVLRRTVQDKGMDVIIRPSDTGYAMSSVEILTMLENAQRIVEEINGVEIRTRILNLSRNVRNYSKLPYEIQIPGVLDEKGQRVYFLPIVENIVDGSKKPIEDLRFWCRVVNSLPDKILEHIKGKLPAGALETIKSS